MEIDGFRVHRVKQYAKDDHSWMTWWKLYEGDDIHRPKFKTLYIGRLPLWLAVEENLLQLMSQFGEVDKVFREMRPTDPLNVLPSRRPHTKDVKCAFVIFKKVAYLKKVLKSDLKIPLIVSTNGMSLKIVGNQLKEDRCVPLNYDTFKEDLATRTAACAVRLEEEEQQKAARAAEAGDEGWVTVSKKYKPVGTAEKGNKRGRNKAEAKKRKMELVNFYAFQARERKAHQCAKFKEEWDKDMQTIEKERSARKFRPY